MLTKNINMVTVRRKKYWFPNAVLNYILKLNFKRNPNIWIFGAWEGNKYDDNSKYFFEYVNSKHPEITAVWLSNNENVINQVKNRGFKAELATSGAGRKWQLRAGKVFYTNGLDDFGNICFFYGAKIIALWHGVGFKKIYFNRKKNQGFKFTLKRIKDSIFTWVYRDITISTSEIANDIFKSSFLIEDEGIYITGLPRNDAFKIRYKKSSVILSIDNADRYNYILYMPTHRPYEDDVIQTAIKEMASDVEFVQFLRENNYKIIFKPHYLTSIENIKQPEEIVVLEDKDISSVQELLAVSDILVSDYSSCITDFATQEKPVLLYAPDYIEYCNKVGVIEPWPQIYKNSAKVTPKELLSGIKRAIQNPKDEMNLTKVVNDLFEDTEIRGTVYSENVFKCCQENT